MTVQRVIAKGATPRPLQLRRVAIRMLAPALAAAREPLSRPALVLQPRRVLTAALATIPAALPLRARSAPRPTTQTRDRQCAPNAMSDFSGRRQMV